MVGDPVIVVGGPLVRIQALPDLVVEQLRDRGHLAGELVPARQGSQRPEPGIAVRSGRRIHHGLSASANGSKIGIGMTSASGASCSAAGSARSPGSGWSGFAGAEAALVRAATRRSRLLTGGSPRLSG